MVKKLTPILLVVVAVICAIPVCGRSPQEPDKDILIRIADNSELIRSLHEIQAHYLEISRTIFTTVTSDLGQIEMTVTNLSTGETWFDSFDSGMIMQTLLPISGTAGYYEIEYVTESGDVYEGIFIL